MNAETHAEPLIFSHTVEALFHRALRGRVSDALRAELRKLGIDLDARLLPAYPFERWLDALDLTVASLYPDLAPAEAFHELGKVLVESYQETMIGRALFTMLRVLPPRRVVGRMARNFRSSNNFTDVQIRDIDVCTVELDFNLVERQPSFTQGILAAGLPAVGIKGSSVTLVSFDGKRATYRLAWGL